MSPRAPAVIMGSPAALDSHVVALVRVAVAVARGDAGRLREQLRLARHQGVPPLWVEELLLQSFLNVGYPLTLAAFGVWRELAGPVGAEAAGEALTAQQDGSAWAERGEAACRGVYAGAFAKLLDNLAALHPAVPSLVVVDAYGKILGRPGLDLKVRELCTLAAIATLPTPRQLRAHLQGALNVGWTRDEIDLVLVLVEEQVGAEVAVRAWEQWAEIRGAGESGSNPAPGG